ncbi:MAG: hypothetical protein IKJ30_00080 [Bacilli bacterium]|nr:hypothetical protein [Bacilli bacterium]
MRKFKMVIFKKVSMTLLLVLSLFSFVMKDMYVYAISSEELNTIEITQNISSYNNSTNRASIDITASDLRGLDLKKSTIALNNKDNVKETISLFDGRVVTISDGNYTYGDYNTSGYMDIVLSNSSLSIYIAALESDMDNLEGTSVTLDYELYLVNSCGNSDTVTGEFTNKYIDYKIDNYSAGKYGFDVTFSFDFRGPLDRKMYLPLFNETTKEVTIKDYYGNSKNFSLTQNQNYDPGTSITFDKISKTYGPVNITITREPYSIVAAKDFYGDIYINVDDIINKVSNPLIDLSNISYYIDDQFNYRFHSSTIEVSLQPGFILSYAIDSGAYDDYDTYTANSYLINGERSIQEYDEDCYYEASKNETITIEITEGSPILTFMKIEHSGYAVSDELTITGNDSHLVTVTVSENTTFKYKYTDSDSNEMIREIEVKNIVLPTPVVKFSTFVNGLSNIDDQGNTYFYGKTRAYLVDDNFEYVSKSSGLPIFYEFSASTPTSYIIDKDDVKILFNGEETNLTLESDIVVELPVDKLVSLEESSENDGPADNDITSGDSDNSNTGLIVTIVVVSVIGVSLVSFSAYWFIFKKKTITDLITVFKKK